MAHGLPVISTQTGGIPELVTGGDVGLLVAPADSRALADAIETLLGDRLLCERMGQAARQRIVESWTADHSAKVLLDAIEAAA